MNDPVARLTALYANTSKHSNYQVLTPRLRDVLPREAFVQKSRSEEERWNFIRQHVEFAGKSVIDVGGNTGFFSFGALDAGASHVTYVEGNRAHSEFVALAAEVLGLESKLTVQNRYFVFTEEAPALRVDVGIVLNVVHHLGDDFGDRSLEVARAKEKMLHCVNALAPRMRQLVFQMGFCWKGNRALNLFPRGLKQEMIDFVLEGTRSQWKLESIGVPELRGGGIQYAMASAGNLVRFDELGEFLNRPLFILRSLWS